MTEWLEFAGLVLIALAIWSHGRRSRPEPTTQAPVFDPTQRQE